MVKRQFLENFNPVGYEDWLEVEKGRAAILQLNGPSGAIDIVTVYLATGEDASRERAEIL